MKELEFAPASNLPSEVRGSVHASMHAWSTHSVERSRRLDYWVGAICEQLVEMTASKGGRPDFRGDLRSAQCGPVGVNRVVAEALDIVRTPSAIARSSKNYFYLIAMPHTRWSVEQGRHTAALNPGDMVLVDSRQPYELRFPTSGQSLSLELPVDWLAQWVPDAAALVGQTISARSGWAAALSSFAQALTPVQVVDAPLTHSMLIDQLGGLLTLTADGMRKPSDPPTRVSAMCVAIERAIEDSYATPGLTAAHIARKLGVSVRSIHRALSQQGVAFSDAVMRARMLAARRMVSNQQLDDVAIGEIGRRVGLTDPSHFVRQYRKRFGVTPGSERRAR